MLTKLENYRVFCKVAQHKSFSGAAQELFLSQPAVSQSVRQLEEQLGMQLFVRSSKKVELTPQGSILYEYASSALGLLESAEQQLSGLQTLGAGQLRLGAGDITARHLLLPALESLLLPPQAVRDRAKVAADRVTAISFLIFIRIFL